MSSQVSYNENRQRRAGTAGQTSTDASKREGVRRPKVLLAEDHDDTRDALSMLLELQGYEVVPACDGEEALRLALTVSPDIVITDYDMPRLDGAGLAGQLRSMSSHHGNVPILVLTALNQALVEQAMQAGANAYVAKPVDFHTLEAAMRMLVRQ